MLSSGYHKSSPNPLGWLAIRTGQSCRSDQIVEPIRPNRRADPTKSWSRSDSCSTRKCLETWNIEERQEWCTSRFGLSIEERNNNAHLSVRQSVSLSDGRQMVCIPSQQNYHYCHYPYDFRRTQSSLLILSLLFWQNRVQRITDIIIIISPRESAPHLGEIIITVIILMAFGELNHHY